MPLFTRYLPITSFIIGSSALIFQTTVLYPWHNDLDAEFKQLKDQKEKMDIKTEEYSRKILERMISLEKKVDFLMSHHGAKVQERKER